MGSAVGILKSRWITGLVALVAMGIGSAATFAVTHRLRSQTADLIIARSEARLEFAKARLAFFLEEFREAESRASAGLISSGELEDVRLELVQLETDAAVRALDVEEARITGRDPDNALSAPVLRGRDYVTERLELERKLLLARAARIEQRASRHGTDQVESAAWAREQAAARFALSVVERRLALRQEFLSGTRTARQVELEDMRFSAEAQRELAMVRVNELQRQVDRNRTLVEAGLASRSEVRATEVAFRAALLEVELAELELQILESKLAEMDD
jgi:hypothetical protein